MKTFDDLKFKPNIGIGSHQAICEFDNGYRVSVVYGDGVYGDGIQYFEVAVLKGNKFISNEHYLDINPDYADDICAYQTQNEVTKILQTVEQWKPNQYE